MSCEVLIEGLEVEADIGALDTERGVPQPLRISVALTVVPPDRDVLTQAFDYREIRSFALALADERIVLVETFAHRLAIACLGDPRVLAAEVRVDKPRAVPNCLAAVRVRLARCRRSKANPAMLG